MSGGAGPSGGIGGIPQYMAQGQQGTGFAPGISMGMGQPAWGTGMGGGNWGVTPGTGLGPYMGGLQQYGMLLSNPAILAAIRQLGMGGGMGGGGGMSTGGPFRHVA